MTDRNDCHFCPSIFLEPHFIVLPPHLSGSLAKRHIVTLILPINTEHSDVLPPAYPPRHRLPSPSVIFELYSHYRPIIILSPPRTAANSSTSRTPRLAIELALAQTTFLHLPDSEHEASIFCATPCCHFAAAKGK